MDESPTDPDFLSNLHAGDTLFRTFAKLGSPQTFSDVSSGQPATLPTLVEQPDIMPVTSDTLASDKAPSDNEDFQTTSSDLYFSRDTIGSSSIHSNDNLEGKQSHGQPSSTLSRDQSSGTLSRNLSRNIPDKDFSEKALVKGRQYRSEEALFVPRSRKYMKKMSLPGAIKTGSYYNHTPYAVSRAIYQSIVSLNEVLPWAIFLWF